MSSTRSVTYNDVANACDTLANGNETISLRSVRHHIGSGSMTTISRYVSEWKRNNRITGVSLKTKRSVTRAPGVAKKRYGVTPKLIAVNSSDIGGGDIPPCDADIRSHHASNVIEFPYQGNENVPKNQISRASRINEETVENENDLDVPQVPGKKLGAMWRECLSATFSPDNMVNALLWSAKVLTVLVFIAGSLWLSVHISGEFFGSKGFETALGVLLGGGVLCFLAQASHSVSRAIFFRLLAYLGTLGFLLVAFSGIKDTAVKETEAYTASKRKIETLEEQIRSVGVTVASLPVEYSKVRDKEYARQDSLQKELDAERSRLASIPATVSSDFSVIGHFIARLVLDVLVFSLFEVLAGLLVVRRRGFSAPDRMQKV